MSQLEQMAYDVLDPEMQAAINASGISADMSSTRLTNLLLVQLLRDSMREVIDVAGGDLPGGDHGAS